ncbi:MAG: hypothetical protein MZV65_44560 [Chromatiales bacterium]|nr:hypothetical protein [Chromatiales bacterium]
MRASHPGLWQSVGHSPKALPQAHRPAAADRRGGRPDLPRHLQPGAVRPTTPTTTSRCATAAPSGCASRDLVAYFCAEFGFHESLPIYSGGLGILAGDHCKAASDMRPALHRRRPALPPGLFLPDHRRRRATSTRTTTTPTSTTCRSRRSPTTTAAKCVSRSRCSGRNVDGQGVAGARSATSRLYLLDTDLPENTRHDRDIAHRLYGGDRSTRIEQEIVLGVGGVRALRATRPASPPPGTSTRATPRS